MKQFEVNWRRVALRALVMDAQTSAGSVIMWFQKMAERREQEATEELVKAAGAVSVTIHRKGASAVVTNTKKVAKPVAKGKQLSRSKTTSKWAYEMDQCPHQVMSAPRGGRNGWKWVTCLECGSRWENEANVTAEFELVQTPGSASVPQGYPKWDACVKMFKVQPGSVPTPTGLNLAIASRVIEVYQMFSQSGLNHEECIRQLMAQGQGDIEYAAILEFSQCMRG